MSHQKNKPNGVKLPFTLRQELGLQDGNSGRGGRSGRGARRGRGLRTLTGDRKQQRQATRVEKRTVRGRQSVQSRGDSPESLHDSEPSDLEESDEDTIATTKQSKQIIQPKPSKDQSIKPKSILKKSEVRVSYPETDDSSGSRASSPGLVLDGSSRTFRDNAAQDDAEILALEKKLGIKKKAKSMGDDMLDYLLDGLEDESGNKKRKREEHDWLEGKRRKTEVVEEESSQTDDSDELEDDDLSEQDFPKATQHGETSDDNEIDDVLDNDDSDNHDDSESDLEGDEFSGFDSENEQDSKKLPEKKVRENPYIAPLAPGTTSTKYIPPSLRKRDEGDQESMERLKKQIQGHLNKLSEANMISILGEIEKLYRTNPRQDVTTALIDLLLVTFCNSSALQNTFIILHAAFVTAIYRVMGTDFGAEMLCKLVECFDKQYKGGGSGGRAALNLVSLLANLFTFNLVSSNIVYDHIHLLLSDFSEPNAELLLRIVRDCGPQLRSDDPTALKGIVQTMQNIAADLAKKGQQLNIRTRVMMDTITDLKNNKMKNATNAAGLTGEHITRMRKALGSLNSRSLKATEPLRITRNDIANSDRKGKWWLVGASWKGHGIQIDEVNEPNHHTDALDTVQVVVEDELDFLSLAKQYRMNTDVRRSIFVAIMSATDCRDAQMRMLKLRLTHKQEQEIAKVLLRCARAEPTYNPYYALLARSLCKENRKMRIGLQFSLWDFFNRMGEKGDEDESDDEDDDDGVEMNEIVNVAKMYAYLIYHGHLNLGVLKTLNIGFLKEQATMFLEILLISIMTQAKASEDELMKVFGRTAETPQIVKSVQYFMRKHVRRSDLISKREKEKVREGCRIADVAFDMIHSAELDQE